MNGEPIIQAEHLTKKFKDVTAVDDVSFTVGKGETFAFLGPNGAGKTTTIKMLITLLKPTSGRAFIDGLDVVSQATIVRSRIGYVPQLISVDGSLTAFENLMLMARLYDIPHAERRQTVERTLAFLRLDGQRRALVKSFSGGMIRKLEIGQAIMHRPHVIFLDEPTSGLDPVARRDVWKHLLELRDAFGTSIFFSTHDMEEADEMAHRLVIMNRGTIAAMDTVANLKAKTGKSSASLEDAFIFFTGENLADGGNFRDIRRARQTARRLG
ncbi:MAG: ATP-binding cassette domain-containing protein [Patescibacteria group bacterium]|nr:ATP-binding cassette domain-containing protein [Patescibacteria group bacterium]MDE2172803.1 ATP-binding cassette domain-containing protein [Patescibacteria group bacterium]